VLLDLDMSDERGHPRVLDIKQQCGMVDVPRCWHSTRPLVVSAAKIAWLMSNVVIHC